MLFRKFKIKSRNIALVGIIEFIIGFTFFIPILALYIEKELFSVTNVALIFTVQAITAAILEIPTGAIADLFGRKKTYLLANLIFTSGIVFLYIGGSMAMFVIFAILTAAGAALVSGTDSSIIYDTLKQEKKEKHYKKITGILNSLWPFGAIIGSVAGGFFATFSLKLPILLSLIPFIIALIVTLFIEEPKYKKEIHRNIFKQMRNSSRVVLNNKQLLLLIAAGLIIIAFGESIHLLKPLFFDFKNIPIEYFGIVFGFTYACSSVGFFFSHRVSEWLGNKNTLIIATILTMVFLFIATLTNGVLAIVFLVITSIFYGLRGPIMEHFLNIEIPSSKRATVLSINNLVSRLGMGVVTPFIGYCADLWNINTAYAISTSFMIIAIALFMFVKDKP
ncbi:MFS transporter [Candidatus Woesearchaeota archaeon]|jgi:MFS family permease|nr:MFS transporter [Candidatus Woesearchaeota archaeon]MBT3538003.1 MFS transporter [Candidatus Woesearchaeota archaeon]MBT4697357.1 MFS transporter [Candidatus Woesearchaeota archaeon]MBT4717078.1 MFS transporter [Candidatus Woesearchaeota archaeon]MBT7105672.1 MFS transporter [Candidatus Woesearchaeota archaeon]